MARAPWAIPNKESGSGNDTVSWSASAHTGREARQTTATFAASGVSPSPILTIIQSGKTEFVSFDSASAITMDVGSWTLEELRDIRVRPYMKEASNASSRYYINFYGATLTIKYTV